MFDLQEMLRYRRPAWSKTERRFIDRYIKPTGAKPDGFGNYILQVGQAPVCFMSHTDTVHEIGGEQKVVVENGFARLPAQSKSDCLGADDTTGVWLMLEMVARKIPGLYIWHRAEEIGGLGSAWIAKHQPETVDGIDYAVSLDRMGFNSVISHQGGRCCSNELATALGEAIGGGYTKDPTGMFTDSALYTDIIGECTNLSVGYDHQHTRRENQSLGHAQWLLEALSKVDFAGLPLQRQPGEYDGYDDWPELSGSGYGAGYRSGWRWKDDDDDDDAYEDYWHGSGPTSSDRDKLRQLVRDNHEGVASVLHDLGITPDSLIDDLYTYGVVNYSGRN